TAPGYDEAKTSVKVDKDKANDFDVELKRSTDSVSGVVKDDKDEPVKGAKVVLDDGKGNRFERETGTDGKVDVSDVPTGDYTVTVTAPGYDEAKTSVKVDKDKANNFDVTLNPTPKPTPPPEPQPQPEP
ncbi:carboxypeptidase-like regulatory domain-containing protein, partial [Corynebacterium sp. HMSC05C01]|uniref:carboxypeptidase-like regulatory domain-containing protein n=1 Tax=Corynebacterium sp. HMSC05C01 TaxID=1581113 RepID=UPI00143B19B7